MASAFANAISFLEQLGLYEVVIPFLLTFVIVFAILEKTAILGKEKLEKDGMEFTKKNLNSLVAFCTGFLVVASGQLVSLINQAVGKMVILFMISIFYLTLVGLFNAKGEDPFKDKGGWRTAFMVVLLIGVILIFMQSIETSRGDTWLEWTYYQVVHNISSGAVSSIILLIIIIAVISFITIDRKPETPEKKKGEN